jgi:hypothetical protein
VELRGSVAKIDAEHPTSNIQRRTLDERGNPQPISMWKAGNKQGTNQWMMAYS